MSTFLRRLEHCAPGCCAIAAYGFHPEYVLAQADKIGRLNVIRLLDNAIIDLEQLDSSVKVVSSSQMNSSLMRNEMFALLKHLVAVLSKEFN
jgi:hypothetical protein